MPACGYLEVTKNIAEILGFLGGFIFFVYKVITGYLIVNVGITAKGKRSKSTETTDYLSVAVTIKKGAHASLILHDARALFSWEGGNNEVELIGIHRLSFKTVKKEITKKTAVFNKLSKSVPFLRLTTDEEATFSGMTEVPKGKPCTIQVVVLGMRHGGSKVGQWRTSLIVLPDEKGDT